MSESAPNYLPGFEPEQYKKLVNSFFYALEEDYTDRVIDWQTWNHEKYDKAAGMLCNYLGYAKGRDFFEAYGFQVRNINPEPVEEVKVKRPVSVPKDEPAQDISIKSALKMAALDVTKKAGAKIEKAIEENSGVSLKRVLNTVNSFKPGNTSGITSNKPVSNEDRLKLKKAVCPNCGASLEIENGIDTLYCQYCGAKVILENQSDATLHAKETKMKIEHKEAMADKVLNKLNERAERKRIEQEKARQQQKIVIPIAIAILAIMFCYFLISDSNHKKQSAAEDAALQVVYSEIQDDILNEKYDEALLKANNLYFTGSYSNDLKKKWNNTREDVIKQIKDKQREFISEAAHAGPVINADDISQVNTDTDFKIDTQSNNLYYHSSGDVEIARQGNSGIYAYKSRGGEYEIFYIIDFDEGYVYSFRNDEDSCDRLRIDYGDLNDYIVITYHDGGDSWQNGLHFKYAKVSEHLILQDNDGFSYDFYATDLEAALQMRSEKNIVDY